MVEKKLIWDMPTRVFHWLLVMMFIMAFLSYDDNRYAAVHVFAGYIFFGLLVFRLLWGVFGSHYARFGQFTYSGSEVWAYVRGIFGQDMKRYIGHNPAGAWAIFALIGLGLLLTLSGLLVLGGEERHGPFAGMLNFRQSVPFRELHEVAAFTLLGLVIIHVIGVLTESILHRENLVGAMFRGTKWVEGAEPVAPYNILAATIITAVLAFAAVNLGGYLFESKDSPYMPFKSAALPQSKAWNEACSECHLAFHPSLLPARSWMLMLDSQDDHFGEYLGLDDAVIAELRQYAAANAADQEQSEAAWRINTTTDESGRPQRITELSYWKKKHEEISAEVWRRPSIKSKLNCGACHLDAKQGTFEDGAMRIPKN